MCWWNQLDKKKGSRPRCVLIVSGSREAVAKRLTEIIDLRGVTVSPDDQWMPRGKPRRRVDGTWDKDPAREARLAAPNILWERLGRAEEVIGALQRWWLVAVRNRNKPPNTPNWDIASTCTIRGKKGLLLIEAKAHSNELDYAGMRYPKKSSNWLNYMQIGRAISEAAAEFQRLRRSRWTISRDHHYQLSNRFAWSWKLASLGIPVVLVYLGFLDAEDMINRGSLFRSDEEWRQIVRKYCAGIVDNECWGKTLDFGGVPFIPLIRSVNVPFNPDDEEGQA